MGWRQRQYPLLCSGALLLLLSCSAHAQTGTISTNTGVPPLQWINLTRLLSGPVAPPLKDASIGYDPVTQSAVIFGGESQEGVPTSGTYLINFQSLEWSTPVSADSAPSARTLAISGYDSASSYRTGFVVIGGLDQNGDPLSDIWEYSFVQQFWEQVSVSPGGPSARYGAVGGRDLRDTDLSIVSSQGTANVTFYLAGGIDGSSVEPLSDVWEFQITGALSENVINGTMGSWKQVSISGASAPSIVGAASTVVYLSSQSSHDIVAVGGCASSSPSDACAQGESYVVNADARSMQSLPSCPPPRTDGTIVPNMNPYSDNFRTQVFLLGGTVNYSQWQNDGGLQSGEVDVLDIGTGSWARILPAGDPGSDGIPTYPTPVQGAAAVAFTQGIVGNKDNVGSDILVFGGKDASGQYNNDVWILRTYNGSITQTNETWGGYGNGTLQTGIDADGSGVKIQYMAQCAAAVSGSSTQTSGSPSPTGGSSPTNPTGTSPSSSTSLYNTSVLHRAFAPISVALCFPGVFLLRLAAPAVQPSPPRFSSRFFFYSAALLGITSFALGLVGLITSFTTLTYNTSYTASVVTKRASTSPTVLQTAHGQAGLAFFLGFYGLVPLLYLGRLSYRRLNDGGEEGRHGPRVRTISTDAAEKEGLYEAREPSPSISVDGREQPRSHSRLRIRSWSGWPTVGRRSTESNTESTAPTTSHRSFEVVNRPARVRRVSANSLAAFSDPRAGHPPRNLSDMSWADGRRSMSAVGELGALYPPTPGTTADMRSTNGLMSHPTPMPYLPRPFDRFLHVLFHVFLLGLSAISLAALWLRAPKAAFIVFLVATVVFYVALFVLAWYGRPRVSLLTVFLHRLSAPPPPPVSSPTRRPSLEGSVATAYPPSGIGPYQHHQPPYRTATSVGLDEYPTSHGHGTEYDDEEDLDEDTRQRRIEEEIARRDVSIVTVPKRRLFLTNPETRDDSRWPPS